MSREEIDAIKRARARQAETHPPAGPSATPIRPIADADDKAGEIFVNLLAAEMGAQNLPIYATEETAGFMQTAAACLRLRDINTTGMAPHDVAIHAIRATGYDNMNSPATFPNVVSAAANKIVAEASRDSLTTYQHWAHPLKPLKDFKPTTILRAGEFGELPEHVDGDEYEQSTFAEQAAWMQIVEYGDEFALTPKMVLDDDANVFGEAIADKADAAEQTKNRACLRLLGDNLITFDTYALFHAQHANDRSAGNPPSQTELDALRSLLRAQMGPSGKRRMGYPLDLVLVPDALETTTEALLDAGLPVVPTAASDAEVFRGRTKYAVEPMLTDWSSVIWYGFAPRDRARSIVYASQVGFETMRVETYRDPRSQNLVHQFAIRFAAAVRNPGGVVRNAGTGA